MFETSPHGGLLVKLIAVVDEDRFEAHLRLTSGTGEISRAVLQEELQTGLYHIFAALKRREADG